MGELARARQFEVIFLAVSPASRAPLTGVDLYQHLVAAAGKSIREGTSHILTGVVVATVRDACAPLPFATVPGTRHEGSTA